MAAEKNAHARLEQVALHIFNRMGSDVQFGRSMESLAVESFRRAKSFLTISEGVESGIVSADPIKPDVPEFIDVPVMTQRSDEKWDPVKDPKTGLPVMQRAPVDRDAYAPNLPSEHPINLRFKPRDGVAIADRKALYEKERDREREERALAAALN